MIQLPHKIIHELSDVISELLKDIINQSLETGKFPEILKLTKYDPVPKKTGKILQSDLRPIALTSFFSEILERVIVERMTSFLTQYDVIRDSMHIRRKGHAILQLLN